MSIGIGQLLIIALIVVLLFGTKKLGSLGSDLGAALKGFKKAVSEDDDTKKTPDTDKTPDADFSPKSLADEAHQQTKQTSKDQDKEQV